ncbi:MAG: NAD-dependent epimerase/dehydratase family protein, partial [Aquabacterium sp.]
MRVLITGAAGFIGQQVLSDLAVQQPNWQLFAADIREITARDNIHPLHLDISQRAEVLKVVAQCRPDAIVHLASVVSPPPGMSEETLHAIDVGGTQAIVEAAVANGVGQLIVTSSGAAYGYYPENAEWIDEHDPLRGHARFA